MRTKSHSFIMPTYGERDLAFARGRGCYLYATSGKKYLDFAGGIAVNSLGHCHPQLVKILYKQSKILWHTLCLMGNTSLIIRRNQWSTLFLEYIGNGIRANEQEIQLHIVQFIKNIFLKAIKR